MTKNVTYPLEPIGLFKSVGTMGALAVAIAGMAPTMAMNLNPQEPAGHVGRIVPLVFAVSTVLVLMVAWCFALLARKHPNAGSAYGFVTASLGPHSGLVAGWLLLGTYVCFSVLGVAAFGLFGANLLNRISVFHHPSSFMLTMLAVVLLAPLSLIPARKVALILILLEGVAVIAMVLLAVTVISEVLCGHGPQGDPPVRDLFIPTSGVGISAIAMGLSFGFLSFAGFEQVATLGEELIKPKLTIPWVLVATVLGAGIIFTLVTAAETLGFGTDAFGIARFTSSTALLADLSARYFGRPLGDLFDGLSIASALGGALAAVMASSRLVFALARDLMPSSLIGKISQESGTPRMATLCVLFSTILGYGIMCLVFHASGSDAFFWASTLGAIALLIVYLLVAMSAALLLIRSRETRLSWKIVIPCAAAGAIVYTLWVNVYPVQSGAYGVIPWMVVLWAILPLLASIFAVTITKRVKSGFMADEYAEKG